MTNTTKTIRVNGMDVQLLFAPKGDTASSQRVWELLKSIYVRQVQEVAR
jgi:hypothetical protein